jgi:aspartate racemase
VLPDLAFQQDCIHRIVYDPVYGIKANANKISRQARSSMQASVEYFKKRKTDAIVLGCTELSLFATGKEKEPGLIMIDSIEALARALIREAVAGTQPVVNCLPTI